MHSSISLVCNIVEPVNELFYAIALNQPHRFQTFQSILWNVVFDIFILNALYTPPPLHCFHSYSKLKSMLSLSVKFGNLFLSSFYNFYNLLGFSSWLIFRITSGKLFSGFSIIFEECMQGFFNYILFFHWMVCFFLCVSV